MDRRRSENKNRQRSATPSLLRRDHVVDARDHRRRLGGGLDGLAFDRSRVEDTVFDGVTDVARLPFADEAATALGVVGRAEVDQGVDGIHPGVLGERSGQYVDGVGERLDRELFASLDARDARADVVGDRDLGRAGARDDAARVERRSDDIEGVLEGALEFVRDVFGAAAGEDGDGFGRRAALDEREVVVAEGLDADRLGGSEVRGSKSFSVPTVRAPVARAIERASSSSTESNARMPSLARYDATRSSTSPVTNATSTPASATASA